LAKLKKFVSFWVFVLFCAPREHLLLCCGTKLMPSGRGFYPAEAVNEVRTFLSILRVGFNRLRSEGFPDDCLQFPQYCGFRTSRIVCNLYSTQRPPSGCRSSGTGWHLLLPTALNRIQRLVSPNTGQRRWLRRSCCPNVGDCRDSRIGGESCFTGP
jgi:hypothetical protein